MILLDALEEADDELHTSNAAVGLPLILSWDFTRCSPQPTPTSRVKPFRRMRRRRRRRRQRFACPEEERRLDATCNPSRTAACKRFRTTHREWRRRMRFAGVSTRTEWQSAVAASVARARRLAVKWFRSFAALAPTPACRLSRVVWARASRCPTSPARPGCRVSSSRARMTAWEQPRTVVNSFRRFVSGKFGIELHM